LNKPFPIKLPLIVLLVAAAVTMLTWMLWPITVLEIRVGENGPVAKSLPVTAGERLTYRYQHSVEKGWIDEILEIAPNGHLVVRETLYDAAGRGIPSDNPDGDFSVDPVTHRLRVSNMNRDIPSWPVRVAFTAQQTVQIGDETFRLDSLAPPTTLLTVSVVTHSRLGLP
jgi:hypothetical protein